MACAKCGQALAADDKFCRHCGTPHSASGAGGGADPAAAPARPSRTRGGFRQVLAWINAVLRIVFSLVVLPCFAYGIADAYLPREESRFFWAMMTCILFLSILGRGGPAKWTFSLLFGAAFAALSTWIHRAGFGELAVVGGWLLALVPAFLGVCFVDLIAAKMRAP